MSEDFKDMISGATKIVFCQLWASGQHSSTDSVDLMRAAEAMLDNGTIEIPDEARLKFYQDFVQAATITAKICLQIIEQPNRFNKWKDEMGPECRIKALAEAERCMKIVDALYDKFKAERRDEKTVNAKGRLDALIIR